MATNAQLTGNVSVALDGSKVSANGQFTTTDGFLQSFEWDEAIASLYVQAMGRDVPMHRCPKCGTARERLQRDHIVPRCRGGTDDPSNIQYICANCHQDKTRTDVRAFADSPEGKAMWHTTHAGRIPSEETRAKLSAAHRGRKASEETRAKMRNAQLGKVSSAETRAKSSIAHRGQVVTAEHRAKISAALMRPETNQKLRDAATSRVYSPEARAAMSAAQTARRERERAQHSEEGTA